MELQKEAVSCGVDSSQFWHMTPRDIRAAIKGYGIKIKTEYEATIELNSLYAWLQGKYNGFAYHDPKNYPDRPWGLKDTGEISNREMTDCEMEEWAKAWASRSS